MSGFVSGSGPVCVRVRGSCPARVRVRVRFVSGLVSGFASGSRTGVVSGFVSVSCLAGVWIRVGFVSGECLVSAWVRVRFVSASCPLRVWFMFGFVSGFASGSGSMCLSTDFYIGRLLAKWDCLKQHGLRLACDGTHSISNSGIKMIALGWLAQHVPRKSIENTFFVLAFALSPTNSGPAMLSCSGAACARGPPRRYFGACGRWPGPCSRLRRILRA